MLVVFPEPLRANLGKVQLSVAVGPVAFYMFFKKRNDIISFCDLPAAVGSTEVRYEFIGRFHADIVGYQRLF
jgi:hypothetical protein